MRTLLTELTTRLQELGCVYIDRYNGQPGQPQAEQVFDTPAAFVEWLPVQWESAGGLHLRSTARLRVHLVQQRLDDSHLAGPRLATFDRVTSLAQGLHGWRSPAGTELVLLQTRFASAYDHQITDVLEFSCALQLC
ncbi:MAG: hypothetical protein KF690_01095 [Bacteroidetes bacterium]|nr:hypothetical protein [Bacteroidota bacterium]